MVDMVDMQQINRVWEKFQYIFGDMIIFLIYVNFIVEIKVFVGKYGGVIVIFLNVKKVFIWVFIQKK